MTGRQCASFFHCYGAAGTRKALWLTLEKTPMRKARSWKTERLLTVMVWPKKDYIMKFSALMEILIKADMVTDAMVSTDCEIEDLNLMDRDYREFGGPHHLLHRHDGDGAGNGDPTVSALQKCFPRIPGGGLRNSARIKENTSLAEVFLLCEAAAGRRAGRADRILQTLFPNWCLAWR